MKTVSDIFGTLVFDDRQMKARLPHDVYISLKKTIDEGGSLDNQVANVVADAMKDWAIEHGATHFTHWFQPLTGITSEKHDGFVSPVGAGTAIMEFSGARVSRMPPASPPAACVLPSRPGAIPPGILPLTLLSRTRHCVSPRHSVPTVARRWIKKPRCCAPCRP